MENKGYIGAIVGIIAVALVAVVALAKLPNTINVSTAPSNVSVTGAPSESGDLIGANAGEISNFTSVETSDDLIVGDDLTIAGDTTFGGSGTTTFSGAVVGNVPRRFIQTMTTATSTPCSYTNNSGSDQTILAVGGTWTASPSVGTIGLNVGTSTVVGVTSTSPLINNSVFANSSSRSIISTTSTLLSAYAILKAGEVLNWKTVTSTNAGTCYALFY